MQRAAIIVTFAVVAVAGACRPGIGTSRPAADGVRALVSALRGDDPRAAYDLMSGDARRKMSYDEFALQWKQHEAERLWQARVLEESLRGDPDVGERASVNFSDDKRVQLEREGRVWRLDSALVSRSRAPRPRDAIKMFADAVKRRDIAAVLEVLTERRREGLARQIDGFLAGLDKRINDNIDELGTDRAEMRWDDGGIRYKIVLRKQDDEWRVDDIVIRPAPEAETKDGEVEGVERD
jgi:hypothetical protein